MSAEGPTVTTTYTETDFPEGPSGVFTATETMAIPQFFSWIQLLLWLLAATFALAAFKRKRAWADALTCLACCCLALDGVPLVISFFLSESAMAMRISNAVLLPFMYAQVVGVGMLAASAFLRWRGSR